MVSGAQTAEIDVDVFNQIFPEFGSKFTSSNKILYPININNVKHVFIIKEAYYIHID